MAAGQESYINSPIDSKPKGNSLGGFSRRAMSRVVCRNILDVSRRVLDGDETGEQISFACETFAAPSTTFSATF